jgi:hypothetical protein
MPGIGRGLGWMAKAPYPSGIDFAIDLALRRLDRNVAYGTGPAVRSTCAKGLNPRAARRYISPASADRTHFHRERLDDLAGH